MALLNGSELLTQHSREWCATDRRSRRRVRKDATMAQVPVVNSVRGHPVILAWDAILQIRRAPAHVGVREWMQAHSESIAFIESDRTGFVTDLDTPEDFVALRARMHPIEVTLPPNANDTNEQ